MSIKAKMLLPRPEVPAGELDEFDPRTELVQKLLEYKRFKEVSLSMQLLEEDRRKLFPRLTFEHIEATEIEDETKRPTLFDLIRAYQTAMKNMPKITVHEIKKIPVTIEQQTEYLLKKLDEYVQISFMKTIEEFADRMTVVVTFLAVLEMAKMRLVNLIVREDYSDFWITKANLAT